MGGKQNLRTSIVSYCCAPIVRWASYSSNLLHEDFLHDYTELVTGNCRSDGTANETTSLGSYHGLHPKVCPELAAPASPARVPLLRHFLLDGLRGELVDQRLGHGPHDVLCARHVPGVENNRGEEKNRSRSRWIPGESQYENTRR